jgi:chromosome segregation protein
VAQEQERRRELARQKEELERQAGERAQRSAELAAALRESQQALAALEGEWQAACSALDACRTNLRRLEGERRAAEERYLRPGPRAVLEAQRAGALSGVVGLLGELVTAPAELSLALDVALGGQFDAVVTACEEDAERAIAFLRAERIGTATFLPLPLLRPRPHPRHVPRGALGWLTDLITVEPALRPAAEAVLGGILVVPDLETAFAVARSSGSRPRLVTQKGEQLFPSGSVTGGFIHPRRARLPDLSAAREDVARWEERAHALGARREALQERCRVLAAEGKGLEAEEERARVALAALDDLLAELDGRVARLVAESRQAEELAQALSAREELLRLSGRLEEERSLLAGAERAREEAQSRLRQAEEELSAVAASLVAVEEQGQAGRAAALSRRRDAVRRLERALNALARHLEAVLRRATLLRTRRLAEVERWREEAERAGAEARAALARLEQEFGASPEGPAQAVPERRLHELRRELQALGPVRPACREELETLDSRLAALAEERRDLTLAKERLLRTMARADEELQRRVRQALVRCQAAFQEIFAELFGGGEGTLCLGAEGLEVEARLPGKHLRRLSLLSGGERSLIALAFLLALVRLRPTPVQVLDEADASLDEENVARLLRFLTRRGGEQYLLISHQRATMEAADVLVGLVMQEPGVTTVVEVELDAGSEGPVGSVAGGA